MPVLRLSHEANGLRPKWKTASSQMLLKNKLPITAKLELTIHTSFHHRGIVYTIEMQEQHLLLLLFVVEGALKTCPR
jgi:hypothetical protein